PAAPQIFHGRQSELDEVVEMLLQSSARVAILGPGGIGKTSLARAALHHADIVAKFQHRYFVSCESALTIGDLYSAIVQSLGIEYSGKLAKSIIIENLSAKTACLLVLDNFETIWEPSEMRGPVEAFLALLADIPQVTLVVTMRGLERPLKVRWTRPFLPPLKPLNDTAAHLTFIDISDAEDDGHLTELLALTGNLPLAITLMASVAAFEGCEGTLMRWRDEHISLLSDGYSKESNLEISLRVSLSSPRMTSKPEAVQLLGLLSVLPDGASDELLTYGSADFLRHKTTLLRTSLAYIGADGRMKSLPPVREFIKKAYGP
ncbi:P-loop containing nucleoside triphosphate hydrolase protein, partial [Mycena epipterygia]